MFDKMLPKQMYLRFFLFLSIIFTVLLLIFSLLLIRLFSDYAHRDIDDFSKHRIEQIETNTEVALQQLKMYGLRMYEDRAISAWLTIYQEDPWLQHNAILSMTDYMTIEPFIDTVLLVNLNSGRLISSRLGAMDIDEYPDGKLIDDLRSPFNRQFLFSNYEFDSKSYLSLIVPSAPSQVVVNHYLILLIDKKKLEEYLILISNEAGSKVVVADDSNALILGEADETMLPQLAQWAALNHNGKLEWKYQGTEWTIRYRKIQPEGWTVYRLLPSELWKDKLNRLRWTVVMFSGLLLALLLAALWWNSHRTYNPLIRRVEQMDMSEKNSRHLVKEELLRQWLFLGRLSQHAHSYLLERTNLLKEERLKIAITRIDAYASFTEQYDFASRKLLKYAMGNIAIETARQFDFYMEAVDLGSDHLVLMFGTDSETDSSSRLMLDACRRNITHYLGISVTTAVSDACERNENLQPIYKQVYEMTTLRFISGEDKIYSSSDLNRYSDDMNAQIENLPIDELIQTVRLRKKDEMRQCIKSIGTRLSILTFAECKLQLTYLLYRLMKSFRQFTPVEGLEGISSQLERFKQLDDCMAWLEGELDAIIQKLTEYRSVHKENLVEEIVGYVESRVFDPMLTAEEVADHVGLSTDYVRRLFKDHRDGSISDYIVSLRLEHVLEKLRTTEMTIAEIAEQCGFQSKSHFFTVFKKVTGLTPSQYRQTHKSGNNN